jgi:hypothetical protein
VLEVLVFNMLDLDNVLNGLMKCLVACVLYSGGRHESLCIRGNPLNVSVECVFFKECLVPCV